MRSKNIAITSSNMDCNMPPKGSQLQKAKRGSTGGTVKSAPKVQSAQKTDFKGFFQQPQLQCQSEVSNIADLNTSL